METTTATPEIFASSWGYDQTNVDFYQVVKRTEKGVYVREIKSKLVSDGAGSMSGRVVALPNEFVDDNMTLHNDNKPKFHRLSPDGKRFKTKYSYATLWDGQPKYCSWYA